jgi:hypothetical protein
MMKKQKTQPEDFDVQYYSDTEEKDLVKELGFYDVYEKQQNDDTFSQYD